VKTAQASALLLVTFALLACSCPLTDLIPQNPTPEPPAAPSSTPRSAFSPILTPSPAPPPQRTVNFYRLRLEFSTTSDWSDLTLEDPQHVLTARLMEVHGEPSHVDARSGRLALNQPLLAAEGGESVGVTVDYALSPEAPDGSLDFLLQKGAVNGSSARVLSVVGDQTQLMEEVSHQGVVEGNTDFNPLRFSVDLTPLGDNPPTEMNIPPAVHRKMVWAFYYPWYHVDDWSSPILRDRPADPYSSDDREAIARHIDQAQAAGIDGFISSWWGPGDYTDRNLRLLLDAAEERDFQVTIYFETMGGEGPLDPETIRSWLAYLISSHGDHPAFFKVNGKPLVVIWVSGAVPLDTWESVFSALRADGLEATFLAGNYDLANLEVFDGLHEYGVFNIPDLAETLRETGKGVGYYSLLADGMEPKLWAATVQPGYDDRLIPGREGLVQDRENGEFYRSTWESALGSDPDWIFITTWNEWWEHTHIEPSEEFGDLYLRLTREYAVQWKRS